MRNKNIINLRLYAKHDADLISIYKSRNISLQKLVKQVLFFYMEKQYQLIILPELVNDGSKTKNEYMLILDFSDDEYEAVTEALSGIKNMQRAQFIKNLVRSYVQVGYLSSYFDNEEEAEDMRKDTDGLMPNCILFSTIAEDISKNVEECRKQEKKKKKETVPVTGRKKTTARNKTDTEKEQVVMEEPSEEDIADIRNFRRAKHEDPSNDEDSRVIKPLSEESFGPMDEAEEDRLAGILSSL